MILSHPVMLKSSNTFPVCLRMPRGSTTRVQCCSKFNVEDYSHVKHLQNLTKVKRILTRMNDSMESMITIDSLQRMGIDYHFKKDIEVILDSIYMNVNSTKEEEMDDLFEVSLCFRLLRQARYNVSDGIFSKFMDKEGRFILLLTKDIRGLLSLYEASQLNKGEDILRNAGEFSRKHLISSMSYLDPDSQRFIEHTLEHPCHMSIQRYKAGYYLNHYRTTFGLDGFLQEVARLDFNIVQSLHQTELKEFCSWWKNLDLAQELDFIRVQPMKWYMWSMTMISDPLLSKQRMELAKVIAFIYVIDDIFDVHGSPDELYRFTDAIDKWEISAMDELPKYMKICYSALYNITSEISEIIFKESGWNPIESLKKMWIKLCKAFLIESKWFASKHVPMAEEYLRNGVISSGAQVVLVHAYFLLEKEPNKDSVDLIEGNPPLISCPAIILRLSDDLGSAKDENQDGFDGSYLEYYMKEHPDSSDQTAREHVFNLISNAWECLDKVCFSPGPFSQYVVEASLNFARMVKVMYRYNDDHLPILQEYVKLLLCERL